MALPKKIFMSFILFNIFTLSFHFKHGISKRNLIFPTPSLLQFIVGVNVPTIFRNKTVSISSGYQMNFEVPTNASYFHANPYIVTAKRSVENNEILTRQIIYQYLENMLELIGVNGKECVQKAICELAEIPFLKENDYVLEDILYFVLSPSTDRNYNAETPYKNSYAYAEYLGKNGGNCVITYPKCLNSMLNFLTNIIS